MACRIARRGMATTWESSRSLEEAKRRALSFFKDCCRGLPTVMDVYILHDIIILSQLRSKISAEFRKHQHVTNPKVVDMLVFKGKEELEEIVTHAKQRHHILSKYVIGSKGMVQLIDIDHGESEFLKKFYISNRT